VNAGSLILFSKRIGLEFLEIKDKDRLYLQIFKWLGFRNTTIEVEHDPRYLGKSSYKFLDLLRLGLQGWTSHSDKLLRISVYIGFFMAFFSFLSSLIILVFTFVGSFQPGWPSLIVVIFFSTGLILLSIGIAGIYIGKTFDQVKDRPLFIIEEELKYEE
jgi:dolichol-phosphate mannosyltransferase